jgi:hypothetical protein
MSRKKYNQRFLSVSFVSVGLVGLVFVFAGAVAGSLEPATASAAVASSSVVITLNVTQGISISSPINSSMSATLGVAQNSAVGTTTWTVITNDVAGYTLSVNATNTPAMKTGSASVADYQTTGTPNTWSVSSGNAAFGYSAFGTDVPTGTWGTGALCSGASGPNATSTTLKYEGFTTSPFQVASRAATTTPSGIATTVCYAVEQNNVFIPSGTYTATIVATATGL